MYSSCWHFILVFVLALGTKFTSQHITKSVESFEEACTRKSSKGYSPQDSIVQVKLNGELKCAGLLVFQKFVLASTDCFSQTILNPTTHMEVQIKTSSSHITEKVNNIYQLSEDQLPVFLIELSHHGTINTMLAPFQCNINHVLDYPEVGIAVIPQNKTTETSATILKGILSLSENIVKPVCSKLYDITNTKMNDNVRKIFELPEKRNLKERFILRNDKESSSISIVPTNQNINGTEYSIVGASDLVTYTSSTSEENKEVKNNSTIVYNGTVSEQNITSNVENFTEKITSGSKGEITVNISPDSENNSNKTTTEKSSERYENIEKTSTIVVADDVEINKTTIYPSKSESEFDHGTEDLLTTEPNHNKTPLSPDKIDVILQNIHYVCGHVAQCDAIFKQNNFPFNNISLPNLRKFILDESILKQCEYKGADNVNGPVLYKDQLIGFLESCWTSGAGCRGGERKFHHVRTLKPFLDCVLLGRSDGLDCRKNIVKLSLDGNLDTENVSFKDEHDESVLPKK